MSRRSPELRVAFWGSITFGALLASYSVFRPVRDSLVLDGDPDKIPWLFMATFFAMLIVSPAWSALLGRGGRRRFVPLAFHAFALCALGFCVLVAARVEPVIVGRVFYVWASVFNLFVISVFWSLLSDLVSPGVARRLYGPIAAGGTVGAIAGPALTSLLVDRIGVEGVLAMSAGLLELAVIAVHQVRRAGEAIERAPDVAADKPPGGGPFDGIVQVAKSPYLVAIVGYVMCTAIAATFVYLQQAKLTHDTLADHDTRTAYFAAIDLGASLVAFGLQMLVAPRLLLRFGPGVVLLALPIAQAAGISILAIAPSLGALAIIQIASRATTHGFTRPARELLFTAIDRDSKYRAKNVIDTVVYRFGDLASSWLYTGLAAIGAGTISLVVAAVPLVGIWLVLAAALGVGFRRRAAELSGDHGNSSAAT